MPVGKIYLVGAGPGHPQLLTIKAHDLITKADILIFDRLIQEDTLADARDDAERIYVGKAPRRHQSRQEEINQILVDAARRASIVVRLKGGDPVLFGRGGEEAEYLARHDIPFEVVPGVTAGLSVPMAAGIPVTHRDFSSSVVLITGHRRDDQEMAEIDWGALARMETLVFFMSVGKLPEISHKLMSHGCPPDTPAAIIQMAYWPGEQVVVGTIKDLPGRARAAEIKPPATIVVGEVVKVRDRLTTLHRDLRRDRSEPVGFGLSASALLSRVGSTLRGAKDLLAAVELQLFDELEALTTPGALSIEKGLSLEPLRALLRNLAQMGLLLKDAGAYRNSEAASRFLVSTAEEFQGQQLREAIEEAESYSPRSILLSTKK